MNSMIRLTFLNRYPSKLQIFNTKKFSPQIFDFFNIYRKKKRNDYHFFCFENEEYKGYITLLFFIIYLLFVILYKITNGLFIAN